jgi:hypothetical protein
MGKERPLMSISTRKCPWYSRIGNTALATGWHVAAADDANGGVPTAGAAGVGVGEAVCAATLCMHKANAIIISHAERREISCAARGFA